MGKLLINPSHRSPLVVASETDAAFASCDIAELHRSIPGYRPTPLVELPALARELGLGRIFVKDEAHRFGLKAFKALGGTYAVYRFVSEYLASCGRPSP